jgi:hypothetical protein
VAERDKLFAVRGFALGLRRSGITLLTPLLYGGFVVCLKTVWIQQKYPAVHAIELHPVRARIQNFGSNFPAFRVTEETRCSMRHRGEQ